MSDGYDPHVKCCTPKDTKPKMFFEQMSPEERNAAKELVADAVDRHCPGCYFLVVLFTPTLTTCVSNTPEEKLPSLLRETADSIFFGTGGAR